MTNASSLSQIRSFDAEECAYLQAAGAQWQGQYLIEDTFKILVAIIIINSIEVVPTIMLNALVIFSVATRQRLRSKSNTLLACLAGKDVLVGLVYQPLGIAMHGNKENPWRGSLLHGPRKSRCSSFHRTPLRVG